MDHWRRAAVERLPEFESLIQNSENPWKLWFDLRDIFNEAYQPPKKQELIGRIYDYFRWCVKQKDPDLVNAAALGFVEHVSQDAFRFGMPLYAEIVADLARYIPADEYARLEDWFRWTTKERQLRQLRSDYRNALHGGSKIKHRRRVNRRLKLVDEN